MEALRNKINSNTKHQSRRGWEHVREMIELPLLEPWCVRNAGRDMTVHVYMSGVLLVAPSLYVCIE